MAKKARDVPLSAHAQIKPEANAYDDHFLDLIGNEFKFDHAKGLAEWMKNSADAYSTTAKVKDIEQFILLRFKQGNPKKESIFECVDYVGMTKENIDKALKIWGLPTAAKKGTDQKTFGGHGNGGKFYMRQMFETSRFITFRGGLLNIFGFDKARHYGYVKGCVNVEMSLEDALKFADIDKIEIPDDVRIRWRKAPKSAGFTVVRGYHPDRFSGRATINTILDRLRLHPQARRVLSHKQVIVLEYGTSWGPRLELPTITPRQGFEEPRIIPLPRKFEWDGESFDFRNKKYADGKLILRTAEQPFSRGGELSALNGVDIMGEIGCIGSYRMHEIGFMAYAPESEFIYGECECPLLEDESLECVRNDREKLVPNELTRALLEWIRQQVDALASEMAEKRQQDKKSRDLRQSSLFNQVLDKWKNKFMERLTAEIFGGAGVGGTFGGIGIGAGTGSGTGEGKGYGAGEDKRQGGENEGSGGGTGDSVRRGPRFPRVLLSGHDLDPLDSGAQAPFDCDERHPPVYQRALDIEHGIYWINTSRPLANKIMERYTASGARWREYMFQRYVDIIMKQSIYALGKRNPGMTASDLDTLIDTVTMRVHDAASEDLESFLFDERLTGTAGTMPPDGEQNADSGHLEQPSMGAILATQLNAPMDEKD